MLKPDPKIIENHLQKLVKERNPYTTPQQLAEAGEYIYEEFKKLNLEVELEDVPFGHTQSRNILGMQKGSGNGSDYFILAAHYDTVEGSPGADDNASAVSALLEIARCLKNVELKKSLLFAAFTLEEYGFVGSEFFIEQARARGEQFLGMISMEMVGCFNGNPDSQKYPQYVDSSKYPNTGDFIAVVGNEPSAALTCSIFDLMKKSAPGLKVEQLIVPGRGERFREINLSDHSPFWDIGTPAVMVTDTAFLRNPNYHEPTDTVETLDIDFIGEVCQGISGFLKNYLD